MSPPRRDPLQAAQEDGGLAFFNGRGGSVGVFPGPEGMAAILRHMSYRDDRFDTVDVPLSRADLLRLYAFIGELLMRTSPATKPEALERLRREGIPPWVAPDGPGYADQREPLPDWPHPLVPGVHYPDGISEMERARINRLRELTSTHVASMTDAEHLVFRVLPELLDQITYLKAVREGLREALRTRGYP